MMMDICKDCAYESLEKTEYPCNECTDKTAEYVSLDQKVQVWEWDDDEEADMLKTKTIRDILRVTVWGILPIVDAVEVVRCRDCKWINQQRTEDEYICPYTGMVCHDEFFCADGERRGENV